MKDDICQSKLLDKDICQGNCQKLPNLLAAFIIMLPFAETTLSVHKILPAKQPSLKLKKKFS